MSWAQQSKHLYQERRAARRFGQTLDTEDFDIIELKNRLQDTEDPRAARGLWLAYEQKGQKPKNRAGISMVTQYSGGWDPRLVRQILDRIESLDRPPWDLMVPMADNPAFNLPSSSALLKSMGEHFRKDRWNRRYNRHAYRAIQILGRQNLVPDDHEIYHHLQENFLDKDGFHQPLTRSAMSLDGWSPEEIQEKLLKAFQVCEKVTGDPKQACQKIGPYWKWLTQHQGAENLYEVWQTVYRQNPKVALELLARTEPDNLNFMGRQDWINLTQHKQPQLRQKALRVLGRIPEIDTAPTRKTERS